MLIALLVAQSALAHSIKVDAPAVVLEHVRVIDGTGAPAREDQSLTIVGGKIARDAPPNAQHIDLTGRTVFPGLVGMHDHLFYPMGGAIFGEMARSFPRLYLAAGVTTIRTTGALEPYTDLELKRSIDKGAEAGPKIFVTGPYLEGEGSFALQMHAIQNPDDARRTVEFWIGQGATSFKAYNFLTRAELKAAIEAAHKHGIKVTGHLCSIGFTEAAELGIDDLEALKIASLNGAIWLGAENRIGTLQDGKSADLVVVKGDPSKKINDIENVELVFKDGVGFDPAALTESVRGMVGVR